MREFNVGPIAVAGANATVEVDNDEFAVKIIVKRKDGRPITSEDARIAYTAAIARLPQAVRFGR